MFSEIRSHEPFQRGGVRNESLGSVAVGPDTNLHRLGIQVFHTQMNQFVRSQAPGVRRHQQQTTLQPMKRTPKREHFGTTEDHGQAMLTPTIGKTFDRPITLERLQIQETQGRNRCVVIARRNIFPSREMNSDTLGSARASTSEGQQPKYVAIRRRLPLYSLMVLGA